MVALIYMDKTVILAVVLRIHVNNLKGLRTDQMSGRRRHGLERLHNAVLRAHHSLALWVSSLISWRCIETYRTEQ